MDLSTLSRQLNMSVHELRQRMRAAGIKIAPRVRKVNNNVAKEIVQKLQKGGAPAAAAPAETKVETIDLPKLITVKDLAGKLQLSVTEVIKKLIENGVMATINEEIDFDTAAIVASEFGASATKHEGAPEHAKAGIGYVAEEMARENDANLKPRPPVVAVMGHVDHGKTTLLDTIRKTDVVATESGAITQHIGAYAIVHEGKKVTFLDTPGHEAFAAMRARGANVTDIIVLVVAADDSVKPQTVEVINRAKLTKTPMVVAINKTDKPDAQPDRVKGDLAALGVNVEDWGGEAPSVNISAKKGDGIDKLLETILLVAEVENLRANPAGRTLGTVIESHLSRGKGPVATVLVQNGTLKNGDAFVVGTTHGKVRAMHDDRGEKLKAAGPSCPVQISGLAETAQAGDILQIAESTEAARKQALLLKKAQEAKRLQGRKKIETDKSQRELKLILRTDVQGSLEAITEALAKLENEDVKLTVVDQKAGEVGEADINLAESAKAVIISFHARITPLAAKLAKQKGVTIDQYDVIYELIEDVTNALLEMMPVEVVTTVIGRAKIKAVFMTEKDRIIIGGEVIEGKLVKNKNFKVIRDKQEIGEGKIESLQQNKIAASEVSEGREFGISAKTKTRIKEGDILEVIDETVKKKTL